MHDNTAIIDRGYQTNITLDRINRGDNYSIIYIANVTSTNATNPNIVESPQSISGIFDIQNIQEHITDNFLIQNSSTVFKEVKND